jgi:hypothetical protein
MLQGEPLSVGVSLGSLRSNEGQSGMRDHAVPERAGSPQGSTSSADRQRAVQRKGDAHSKPVSA